jgi:hypothetical protein
MAKAKNKEERAEAAEHKEALNAAAAGLEPKIVKVSEELSCQLNEVEWQNRARELAEAHKDVARQEERKKTVAAGLTNDVKIAKAKESKLADIVATREEQREITVEVKYDYELGKVTRTRTDTKEVISEREMTDNERQSELDLAAASNSDAVPKSKPAEDTGSSFDPDAESEDEDVDGSGINTYKNLDDMNDAELAIAADELGVSIEECTVTGDHEATRENIKVSIREEIERRADVEEADRVEIDESELE